MSRARDFADLAGSADAGGLTGKNMVVNGAMQVAQRGVGPTAIGPGYYTVDRFKTHKSNDGAFTSEQSTDHPNGSGNSVKLAVTTADTSVGASQYLYMSQHVEAKNLQHLLYGTSSAKHITLSFWVKSNKTGTYSIVIRKTDTTAYNFVHEYTISSADTWEKKEITISPTAGSTSFITASGGAIANDTGSGLQIGWNLAFGSTYNGATNNAWSSDTNDYATSNQVNWMDSTSNNFYLTEVQLEVGEQATPFEHRSYGEELSLCQRYYEVVGSTPNTLLFQNEPNTTTGGACRTSVTYSEKRAAPTASINGTWTFGNGNTFVVSAAGVDSSRYDWTSTTTAGESFVYNSNAGATLSFDAEL